jgi:hypothetical protein
MFLNLLHETTTGEFTTGQRGCAFCAGNKMLSVFIYEKPKRTDRYFGAGWHLPACAKSATQLVSQQPVGMVATFAAQWGP